MKRYVVVDWENKAVFPEAYETTREAWRATVEKARADNRSPNEFDPFEVEIEAR